MAAHSSIVAWEIPRTEEWVSYSPWDFSRQEYCSGLPFPTPGNLPNPGIEPSSFVSPALAGRFFITASPGKPKCSYIIYLYILVHHGSELR